jgi:LacI family transcriptional regulator
MVLDLASKMGYRTSFGVRGRKKKDAKARFLGVLFYDDGGVPEYDTAGQGFLTGLSAAAALRDASLIVHRFGPDSREILDPARQPAALRDGLIEGLVLVHRIDPEAVRSLATALPTVLLTHAVRDLRADLVDADHIGGVARLMDHLHQLGHRRIGFVGLRQETAYSQARFGSYCQSLARLGLELRHDRLISVFDDSDFDRQAELAHAAIRDGGVTALVCVNDHVGYQLCRRLINRGVRVPEDVSLTGFDAMTPILNCPALTTLRVPFERAALPALQTLFDCQFVDGQTTGAASERPASG